MDDPQKKTNPSSPDNDDDRSSREGSPPKPAFEIPAGTQNAGDPSEALPGAAAAGPRAGEKRRMIPHETSPASLSARLDHVLVRGCRALIARQPHLDRWCRSRGQQPYVDGAPVRLDHHASDVRGQAPCLLTSSCCRLLQA